MMLPLAATLAALVPDSGGTISHVPGFKVAAVRNEMCSQRVAAAGDVNRDGFGDVLVYSVKPVASGIDGVVRVHSGLDGALLYTFSSIGNVPFDGIPMSGAGDVDGDGHADVIVGSAAASRATLYSGRNGSELFAFHGDLADDGFGGAVAAAGDVDGDGHPDVIIGTAGWFGANAPGYARVFSGADGTPLLTFHEESAFDNFGRAVSGVGDVNGDGHADLAVGAYTDGLDVLDPGVPPFIPPYWTEDQSGSVSVFSGADGAALWTVHGSLAHDQLGWSLSGVGDVNADGFDDVLTGNRAVDLVNPGYARILSGLDGSTLRTFSGTGISPAYVSVGSSGDLDGDGVPDALVACLDLSPFFGVVRAFSGADGSPLFEYQPQFSAHSSVAGLGDVNGDGIGDFVVGAPEYISGGGFAQLFVSQGVVGHASAYGCGGNPPGSMAVIAGTPALGATVTLALDDPSGGMRLPAAAFLLVSSQPDAAFPCGTPKPNWGLASPGSAGELLVGVEPPNPLLLLNVGTYTGVPLEVRLTIPSLAGLLGETVYVQGALVDASPRIGLTDAVELLIGVP